MEVNAVGLLLMLGLDLIDVTKPLLLSAEPEAVDFPDGPVLVGLGLLEDTELPEVGVLLVLEV